MHTITVETGRPYAVHIGHGVLERTGKRITKLTGQKYKRVVLITDDVVKDLYGKIVEDSIASQGYAVSRFIFANGEASKTVDTVTQIISFLCSMEITRSDLIVALGGGVVGDVAGFAASIYLRGIDYVQIPTTFLAAVDSSVGGKTAVNIAHGKNLVGTFWQPRLVICDAATMPSLPPQVFADGTAEAIKYGCIRDESLLSLFENNNFRDHLPYIIHRCIEIKAEIVGADEQDHGLRQILNFGHTVAHAIEKLSGYSVSHGHAVAAGMCIVSAAGEAAGITPAGTAERISGLLSRHGLPTGSEYSPEQIAEVCLGDKKRSGDTINFILLEKMGKAVIHPIETASLAGFLAAGARR